MFAILIIVLLVKPSGIMGKNEGEKVRSDEEDNAFHKQSYLVCFLGILAAFGIVMALCESGLADPTSRAS